VPPLTLTKLRLNAEQGDTDDQYNLGFPYANGERVTLDYAKATYWFARQLNKETRALN
jgi:TPR repeat protein